MLALGGLFATYGWLLIVFIAVTVVTLLVPTLIAQQLFRPSVADPEQEEALGEEDLSIIHRSPAGPIGD